jgi:hypothetical protein
MVLRADALADPVLRSALNAAELKHGLDSVEGRAVRVELECPVIAA